MILFYIVPGLLALISLLWVTNQIQKYKFAYILPWINLVISIFVGNIFRKIGGLESPEALLLYLWCIGAGVSSFFTAIIIDFYLYTHAFPFLSFPKTEIGSNT